MELFFIIGGFILFALILDILRKPKKRYFFIAYRADDKNQQAFGNLWIDATILPSNAMLCHFAMLRNKKEVDNYIGDESKYIITSIYEFKNKADYENFKKKKDGKK